MVWWEAGVGRKSKEAQGIREIMLRTYRKEKLGFSGKASRLTKLLHLVVLGLFSLPVKELKSRKAILRAIAGENLDTADSQ